MSREKEGRVFRRPPSMISLRAIIVSNPGYGYWWQADMKAGDKSYFTSSAQGGGGHYIILIDALDLIVVTTAYKSKDNILQVTADRILPAFVEQP